MKVQGIETMSSKQVSRGADARYMKTQKHRHERRRIREFLKHGDWQDYDSI